MTRALLCIALGLAAGCGGGDDKVKPPDRTYPTPSGDAETKEKGTDVKEG